MNLLRRIVDHPLFDRSIIFLIILNAITLGMETSAGIMSAIGPFLKALDTIILTIFVIELTMRFIAYPKMTIKDPWRIFDFIVIGIALMPATGAFSALRAFRILRVLRLISNVPAMRRVVQGLLNALPGMGSIVMLLSLIFYIFAVISTKLFAASFPEWFGSIGASAYTLFQIMTLESWSMGIVRPVMEIYPWAWMLFLPFIISTAFAVLNLFIGVIVDAMQSEHEAEAQDDREQLHQEVRDVLKEVKALREEVKGLKG